ncbi:gamma carbonic anhydrase family protein [Adlercreutzia sp. ZJ242]|uniref:gamma carbonic anhydrase family protein n=1 Tax=Adlercreutzia sp. ZJ242 TaxID=2709409 RepID=UPI0013E9B2D1|nr:gamma carbonic anhydrase family protein [Adlercreutzia sp. ZJ242]
MSDSLYPAPVIDPSAFVAQSAVIVGDVTIGADATVLFNATLRGDCDSRIVVGDRTNIQELACVHVSHSADTLIGSDVTVGHGAIVHGCTIGDGTLVGMGAIIIDGARVGERCLIGAGALVTGSADIPDEMLVIGSPARAVRKLTPEEVEGLAVSARDYVQVGRDLAQAGLNSAR